MDLTLLHINGAWVVLRAVTIRVSCPHGVSRVGSAREREFSFWSHNKSFIIDQACWVKRSVYLLRSLLWSKYAKEEHGQYPVILTEQAWSIRNDYYLIIKFKHGVEDNKTAEKNEVNIQPSLPHAWSITHISWPNKFSRRRICYMVKTICILVGQSECSRAVLEPDLRIRAGGGGERGGHPDPGIKGGERCEKCFFNHFPLGSLTYYVACITVALWVRRV